ncbi:MAG: calcium-translocating P-type ATPase, PMCA-type [Clostridia bacterium]|nr:calcium-translocating P-type ATPase, PMCA-type [Clostridia bacterium]
MNFYDKSIEYTVNALSSDKNRGLSDSALKNSRLKHGVNALTKKKKRKFIFKVFDALKEPMLIILLFGFVITFGTNLGKFLKTGEGDFSECFGILFAVLLSVTITLIMEGSSARAFETLNKIYDNVTVKVVRSGQIITVSQLNVAVGDILLLESGDKIVADGRVIESNGLTVDESALTGESVSAKKDANIILTSSAPLAERKNCLFSGTFVTSGNGKMIVTAIGDKTEIGCIAGELSLEKEVDSPLQTKLAKLGKTITIIGATCAILVFIISAVRLALNGGLTFASIQELFISCIVLIVAAVPEGLPTIVAVSLALNMIKLAKGNALIKKMIATETTGAVSVICSDKTGTLTQNKMTVMSVCLNEFCLSPEEVSSEPIFQNFVCNSTADLIKKNGKIVVRGSSTEGALINAFIKSNPKTSYVEYRNKFQIVNREPFSSDKKMMSTTINFGNKNRILLKGAPERVLNMCSLTYGQIDKLLSDISKHQAKARRVLCFAHLDYTDEINGKYVYDGYVSIADPIRSDVIKAVKDCQRAGIKVKILTGDNVVTAFAVANELGVANEYNQVVNAIDLEKLSDEELKKIVTKITVIARSTPLIKLRVVRALKSLGEVVAVTGDGINDAPAIKHADVGIAMGISGSEITKEAADMVLLDDSFSTVVKAVAFGRNVYKNLQRFILFQLSVNLSALLFITVCAVLNLPTPFNTLQLLWINVIMDGPPALTLGLESASDKLMQNKPVKRSDGIVGVKMLFRIIFNGVFIGAVMILQYVFNFLNVLESEKTNAIFTTFILFQLFNAFNSRELGSESIFKSISRNKVMVVTFICVFMVHLFITQVCYSLFGVNPMSLISWIKILLLTVSIIFVSEIYKLIYRTFCRDEKKKSLWRNKVKAKA